MKKSDSLLFELTKSQIITIFVYYFVIMLVGIALSIYVLCNLEGEITQNQLMIKIIVASLSVSAMLSSLQYIKRLYKACITNRIAESPTFMGSLGNTVYFLLRPFYAFVFVIIMIFAVLSGMFTITGNLDYIINDKFLYLCVVLSSYIGYSVGNVLDKFEKASNEKILEYK